MSRTDDHFDDDVRATLQEQVRAITTVTPWRRPAGARRASAHPQWWIPLAAAAAVLLVVAGVFVTRTTLDSAPAHPSTRRPDPQATSTIAITAAPSSPSTVTTSAITAPSSGAVSPPTSGSNRTAASTTVPTPAPSCHSSQLRVGYRSTGAGSGTNFGVLDIVNTSATPCRFSGELSVTPLGAPGGPLVVRPGWHNRVTATGLLLVAHQHLPSGSRNAGGRWAELLLGANLREYANKPDGCPLSKQVAPQRWRVTGAARATVANFDPRQSGGFQRLTACNEGGLILEDVVYHTAP